MSIKIISSKKYRDIYAVGDIHGEITKLNEELHEIGFDKNKDLLLSVGDLIDRGENSLACLGLIEELWFECVMGNHEKMAFDAVNEKTTEKVNHWVMNGGDWFIRLDDKEEAERLIIKAGSLPLIIELNIDDKKIIICHADYPHDEYKRDLTGIEEHLLWSRERIGRAKDGIITNIKGADQFIFGHTPLKEKLVMANQTYIDTGACFGNKITIIRLTQP